MLKARSRLVPLAAYVEYFVVHPLEIAARRRPSPIAPDNVIEEVLIPEYFIHQRLDVVGFFLVEMNKHIAVVRKQFADQHQPLSQKLKKLRTRDLVLIRLLLLRVEIALGPKRRIDVHEAHSRNTVGVAELSASFGSNTVFHDLRIPKISMLCQLSPFFPNVRTFCSGTARVLAIMSSSRSLP